MHVIIKFFKTQSIINNIFIYICCRAFFVVIKNIGFIYLFIEYFREGNERGGSIEMHEAWMS